MAVQGSRTYADVNGVGGGYLGDLAFAQSSLRHFLSHAEVRRVLSDPALQDLDHTLASRALEVGCVLAINNDAHTTTQLSYAETALAHARLAGIPTEQIVKCWPLDRFLARVSNPSLERRL
jgi:histidinol phosphatase-like PHP family hydrolase